MLNMCKCPRNQGKILCRGSEGMLPQEILKFRSLKWDFQHFGQAKLINEDKNTPL